MSLLSELRRRNVLRMVVLYVVAAWLIMQVVEVLMSLVELPPWTGQVTLVVLAIGFPITLAFSWFYELTPEGMKLDKDVDAAASIAQVTGRRMDFVVISLLAAALLVFAYDKWWIGPAPERSIAVLPFENMSDDPGNEYFSDGISEDILNLLAQVPELRVTSRSSAFSFKGRNLDVPTMAARLNVAPVLEGSVRRSGNQLRIVAQLIEVETDTHLWSESYDRELKNMFAIQDEIAAAVVDALKITLLGKAPKATKTDPAAYTLYLQGRYFGNQITAESSMQAETLLKQALEIDPGFAAAWAALGSLYRFQADPLGVRPIDEGNELARNAFERVLAIDPQNSQALAILARIEGDDAAAYQHLQDSLASNPGDARILLQSGWMALTLGELNEAIDLMQRSVARNPVAPLGHINLGIMYFYAHRLDDAAESAQMAISLNPDAIVHHFILGLVLLAQGDAPAALAMMEQEVEKGFRLTGTAIIQHALGDAGASDAALQNLIECCSAGAAYQLAETCAYRGDIDAAFEWLEQAYDNKEGWGLIPLLNPLFANLHNDPRLDILLDKWVLPH